VSFFMIYEVCDLLPLTLCINCSCFIFISAVLLADLSSEYIVIIH